MRETYLDSDFSVSNAPASDYNTDLENFWTQNSNFSFIFNCDFDLLMIRNYQITFKENFVNSNDDETTLNENINILNQKYKVPFYLNLKIKFN